MIPWLKRAVIGFGLAFIGLGLALLLALRPPRFELPAPGSFELSGVTIVNPGQPPRPGQRVRVEAGRIAEIGPAPEGAPRGGFLLPGLIDHHVHVSLLPDHAGLLLLRHGVTSVRDPAAASAAVDEYKRAWREGSLAGPRLYACGLPLEGSPPTFGGALVVATATEARRLAKEQLAEGVDCLKVYNTLSPDALRAVTTVAARHGVPVVGHVPVEVPLEASGLAGIEHLTGFPGPMSAEEARRVGLAGWLRRFAEADDERVRHFAAASRELGAVHTPTLVLWHEMHEPASSPSGARRPEHALVPRFMREVLWAPSSFPPYYRLDAAGQAALQAMLSRTATVVMALHRHGVPILAGSDAPSLVVPGAGLWRELRWLRAAGLSAEEALHSATAAPGQRLSAGLGRIEVGAPADLVRFGRNPAEGLEHLDSLEEVVVAGRRYSRDGLDAMIARSLEHYDGWLVSRVWAAIVGRVARSMNERAPALNPPAPGAEGPTPAR